MRVLTLPSGLFYLIAYNNYLCYLMSRSKKIFVGFAIAFFAFLAFISYDISSRTTFPGSKPQLKERLKKQYLESDSVAKDTISAVQR